jgi:hypothetical protein
VGSTVGAAAAAQAAARAAARGAGQAGRRLQRHDAGRHDRAMSSILLWVAGPVGLTMPHSSRRSASPPSSGPQRLVPWTSAEDETLRKVRLPPSTTAPRTRSPLVASVAAVSARQCLTGASTRAAGGAARPQVEPCGKTPPHQRLQAVPPPVAELPEQHGCQEWRVDGRRGARCCPFPWGARWHTPGSWGGVDLEAWTRKGLRQRRTHLLRLRLTHGRWS